MQKYVVLEKAVGETPLACMESWRSAQGAAYADIPLAYAGRLDPMASGKLLVLIGEECKHQEQFLGLDKEYVFEVLFGVRSDTADVLGLVTSCTTHGPVEQDALQQLCTTLTGEITLPYPVFSSKTVKGKPLHTWALQGRLDEIEIPTKRSTIYSLKLIDTYTRSTQEVYEYATQKIATIPPVTEARKALGKDFRRDDVHAAWDAVLESYPNSIYTVARFTCIASSGTYMRTLAEVIGQRLDSCGLAFSIHRTEMGSYKKFGPLGLWTKQY